MKSVPAGYYLNTTSYPALYAAGPALFPTVGSVNPVLTGTTLAAMARLEAGTFEIFL
jgi:hypothetical protein